MSAETLHSLEGRDVSLNGGDKSLTDPTHDENVDVELKYDFC